MAYSSDFRNLTNNYMFKVNNRKIRNRYVVSSKLTVKQCNVIEAVLVLLLLLNLNIHAFYISNTFISNSRLKLAKNKQTLSNTLRLNFRYLIIICFPYLCYHPKIIDFLKNVEKQKRQS